MTFFMTLFMTLFTRLLLVGLFGLCGLTSSFALAQSATEKGSQTIVISDDSVTLPKNYRIKSSYAIDAQSEMVIQGNNLDSQARIVILRFDDSHSTSYRTRLNIERLVNPGPFTIHLPLFGLKTAKKRQFEWDQWRKFVIFSNEGDGDISVKNVVISRAANFSNASQGFDLGSKSSPVLTGMSQIAPGFKGLKGKHLKARHHVSGNALTSDGIEGIDSLDIPLPNGHWDVTLWFAMQGAWENLPRQRNQHIRVQDKTVWQRDLTPQQWLKSDYLAGQQREAWLDGTPWQLFGEQPAQRVTTSVEVSDGLLHIKFSGRTTHDNYLAGVFVSPMTLHGTDNAALNAALQERFEQKWQVVNSPKPVATAVKQQQVRIKPVYFDTQWLPQDTKITRTKAIVTSLGSHAVLDFAITSTQSVEDAQLDLVLTDAAGKSLALPVEIRQGMWRYQRPQGSSTLLQLSADELQTLRPGQSLRLSATLSRRINLLVPIPADFNSHIINAELTLRHDNKLLSKISTTLKVLPITLPPVRQAIGIYHEKAPHWAWFSQLKTNADTTLQCDYRYLSSLGLTALSPPLTTPNALNPGSASERNVIASLKPYISDLKRYHQQFKIPAIDFTTVKRFDKRYRYHDAQKQQHLRTLIQQLGYHQLAIPQFAVADEVPELNAAELTRFSQSIAQLQNAIPGASLVGQLNKPANKQILSMFDTLLINNSFGVSKEVIRDLQQQGKSVWLYNMGNQRAAAGFFLWKSQAQGYLQWHGRMPTGAPYNPLDGRESDFQMIYPAIDTCATPDINAGLLAIAQGIVDRQWLNWLLKTARTNPTAKKVLQQLKRDIPPDWDDIETLDSQQNHRWRKKITDLALSLSPSFAFNTANTAKAPQNNVTGQHQ